MAKVLDANPLSQKSISIPPSPSAFTRLRAMTRKVAAPFSSAVTRQTPGTDVDSDELGSDANFDDHVPATPTPKGNLRSRHRNVTPSNRLQNVPGMASNHTDLGEQSAPSKTVKIFSSADLSTTARWNSSISGRDLSASSGLPADTQIGSVADKSNFTIRLAPKSAGLANSASPEPIPATSKTQKSSKGLSEASGTGIHGNRTLQDRQNAQLYSKSRISAISTTTGAAPKPPPASPVTPSHSVTIAKKGKSSLSHQIVSGNLQDQSGVGRRRIAGLPSLSNPPRPGVHSQSGIGGQSSVSAGPTKPSTMPPVFNFFAPLEDFPAFPPSVPTDAPSATRSALRRRRESSDSEPDHTVKIRLLQRPDLLSARPQVAKGYRSKAAFTPSVQSEDEHMSSEESDGNQAANVATAPLSYSQVTAGDTVQDESPPVTLQQVPSPSMNSHHVAALLSEAEQLLSTAFNLIEQATSLGGTLSPRLKQVLGNLGSSINEEELLKKVGDLVESKLAAAFAQVGSAAPSQPAPKKPTITKSANPVPIHPTRVTPLPPKPRPAPKSGAMRHHPARLILQVSNPETHRTKPPVVAARDAANVVLQQSGAETQVAGVTYTAAGNIVLIARPPHTAQDLLPHASSIAAAILGDGARCVGRRDVPWFRVQVNTVPVHYENQVMSPDQVFQEIKWSLGDQDFPNSDIMASAPRWMCSPSELAKKNHASVVFSFSKEEDARRFKEAGAYLIWGKWCKTATYEDRPQVRYCAHCWSIDHPTTGCRRQLPRCKICAHDHATEQHVCAHCGSDDGWCPEDTPVCCNCKGKHLANAYDCPERKRKLGQFAKKTAVPAKRQAAPAPVPAQQEVPSSGEWQTVQPAGGRKTKKSSKSKAMAAPVPKPTVQPTLAPSTVQKASSSHTVRRVHSDPTLTPGRAGPSQKQSWADEMEMDVEEAESLFGIPVPTGDDDLPDLS